MLKTKVFFDKSDSSDQYTDHQNACNVGWPLLMWDFIMEFLKDFLPTETPQVDLWSSVWPNQMWISVPKYPITPFTFEFSFLSLQNLINLSFIERKRWIWQISPTFLRRVYFNLVLFAVITTQKLEGKISHVAGWTWEIKAKVSQHHWKKVPWCVMLVCKCGISRMTCWRLFTTNYYKHIIIMLHYMTRHEPGENDRF